VLVRSQVPRKLRPADDASGDDYSISCTPHGVTGKPLAKIAVADAGAYVAALSIPPDSGYSPSGGHPNHSLHDLSDRWQKPGTKVSLRAMRGHG